MNIFYVIATATLFSAHVSTTYTVGKLKLENEALLEKLNKKQRNQVGDEAEDEEAQSGEIEEEGGQGMPKDDADAEA